MGRCFAKFHGGLGELFGVFCPFFFLGGGSNLEVSTNSLCSERLVTWVITNKGKDEVSTEPSKKDQVE